MMAENNVFDLGAWKGKLAQSKQGFKRNMSNLMLFLENVRDLGKNIRWNELANRPEWVGEPITDNELVQIRLILEANDFEPNVADILPGVIHHARKNSFHPIRDYLTSLKWDGKSRIDGWLIHCLGAPDTLFNRAVARKTLIASVARAFRPGCKVDTVLVLEGPQGIRKSTAIAMLFGEQYTAESVNLFDQHNKMVMSMMGAWCVELAEFIAIARRDQNTVKGMLSMRSDRVVLPYAKMASDHPRQCVFFGTINPGESGYLTDATGNRRYWPVEVTMADVDMIRKHRDQMWAEAYAAFQNGEQWWLSDDEEALAGREVAKREEYDVWDEVLTQKFDQEVRQTGQAITSISIGAALQLIGVPNERMGKRERDRVASCLRRLGFNTVKISKDEDAHGKRHSVRVFYLEEKGR